MPIVYYLIGDVGSAQYADYWSNLEQVDQDLGLCIFFLTDRYGMPPSGSKIEVITATYYNDFRTIALGFDDENEPEGAFEYSQMLEMALQEFNKSVDWQRIQPAAIESVITWKQRNLARLSGQSHPADTETKTPPF